MLNEIQSSLWTEIIPSWLEAIGTVLAVLVALFYKPIIDFITRPKFKITCPNNNICIEKINVANESSTIEKRTIIRVKIENTGKSATTHSEVIVDTVYKKQSGNTDYVQTDYAPFHLKDNRGGCPKALAPNLIYYFDVAVISKHDVMSNVVETSEQKQFYKLSLFTEKSLQLLGVGTFIIPIKVYGTRLSTPAIAYLKIYWDSDAYTVSRDKFSVEVISEQEFNNLKIINS